MLDKINYLLLVAIIIFSVLLVLLIIIRKVNERAKRAAELVFGESKKKEKPKSPNAILAVLLLVTKIIFKSKVFEKLVPYPKGIVEKKLEHDIMLASKPFDLDSKRFTQLKVVCSFVFFILLFIIAVNNPNKSFYYYAVIFGVLGYFYPNFFIMNTLQIRKRKISRLIPDAMDFISLCLAAGMNFQLAIEEYIQRNDNLLADEFSIFSNEMQVGISRVDGFQHMLERNESPELKNFLSSVIQSERLGTPLRPVITNQAVELRGKRKQMVEKAIAGAPVKMLFPLIMFILPAMLMIILGSVLLPAAKLKGIEFTTNNFYFYQVTPQVKVILNGKMDLPLIHVKRILDKETGKIAVFSDNGQITSYAQQDFLVKFFKEHEDREDAWFVRIDLPENTLNVYNLKITSSEEKNVIRNPKLVIQYIKFELEQFKEDKIFKTSTSLDLRGHISPGITIVITNNDQPVNFKNFNSQTGDFETSTFKLSSGVNTLKFSLKLKTGLVHEIIKSIVYTGADVSASFADATPTLKDKTRIVGLATPGSRLTIRKLMGAKFETIIEKDMGEERNFDIIVPLTFDPARKGENFFQLYAEKDGNRSPNLQLSITRALSE
jgi:tight adherence protein C